MSPIQSPLAVNAAEQLFNDWDDDRTPPVYEPRNSQEANAAVRRLSELFKELPGTARVALDAARGSGNLLSSDRLQGLAEIVQNADDVEASQVRLYLRPTDLLISHDGLPVHLPHVLGFATPWLSTKGSEADTTGRFGIGLTTLRSLSKTIGIHCHPYHIQFGEPTLSPIDLPTLPLGLGQAGWTILRVPLKRGVVSPSELEEWLDRWDDAALLFLQRISKVTLLNPEGISSDHDEISDLRNQRGVGADAIDELQRFYELKVSAGAEPDQVTLTNAEVKRALTTPDFFLVVVSGVEGTDAQPKVRVIIDPLSQLQPTESGSITLSGVRNVTSLSYDFAPIDDPERATDEER